MGPKPTQKRKKKNFQSVSYSNGQLPSLSEIKGIPKQNALKNKTINLKQAENINTTSPIRKTRSLSATQSEIFPLAEQLSEQSPKHSKPPKGADRRKSSLSISENPHLNGNFKRIQFRAPIQQKRMSLSQNHSPHRIRRSGQWTTLCPFCSTETVAKIEIFGGLIPDEFKNELNKFQSYTLMDLNGISRETDSSNKQFRKTFNLFSYERLHERVQRIVGNAYPYYPSTKLPLSFPRLTPHDNRDNKSVKSQDRAIKIIRSKEELFWNICFYFKLLSLPTQFLFGGMYEFQTNKAIKYELAALPHHSWCFVSKSLPTNKQQKRIKDGLEKYYECDKILKHIHPTLYASLKPMVRDRLYDALILVLQQRGLIQEEQMKALKNKESKPRKKRGEDFVMNEPLYRLFGKLICIEGDGRNSSLIYTKSFNKSCGRLSHIHRQRLIVPQDSGVKNEFASRIQDILLLIDDTYHTEINRKHQKTKSNEEENLLDNQNEEKSFYDIDPNKFHMILENHTFSQLLQIHDRAQKQIDIILKNQQKEEDFLFGATKQIDNLSIHFD